MTSKQRSLTNRIILLSGIWIIMALVGTGVVLLKFYRDHIIDHYDSHVLMHMEEMVSAASLSPNGELALAYPPSDPRYQVSFSGWYWEIRHRGRVLARSPSLMGQSIDLSTLQAPDHDEAQVISGPDGAPLRVRTMQVPSGVPGEQLLLVASAPMLGVRDDVTDITEHVTVSFTVLALGLILAVALQIRLALQPIKRISDGISDIHQGRTEQITGEFPRGLQPLVDELNHLVEHNSVLLRRARNQLGDLAHSIKNPLTVINNEARSMGTSQGSLILKQSADIAASVDHHLSRARAFGTTNVLGTVSRVRPVAEDLVFAMQRIHKKKDLDFDLNGLGDCIVRCEAQDLEEMLGNLLDNACKWAGSRVIVHCRREGDQSLVFVEDDGPGIPKEKMSQVLQRGQRLDESMEGHGLGLGIVQDLLELYRGELELGQSRFGGLSACLKLPGR